MFERLKKTFGLIVEKVSTEELTRETLDELMEDFKTLLLQNDVAFVVTEKITEDLKVKLDGVRVKRLDHKKKIVKDELKAVLLEVLTKGSSVNILKLAENKRKERIPFSIVFAGINGTGKTTTIAKVASFFLKHGFSVVLACSDTYRAGAIEQLEEHARRLGVKLIKHEYGSDPASVAFDTIAHAEARGLNIALIDTAGRMETNRNLMDEMSKIVRTVKPDLVIFVGDGLAGNDAVSQAEEFNRFIPISASILTKMDADAKGGAAISIAYITGKPIAYLGVGQEYSDLKEFNPEEFIEQLIGKNDE